MNPPQLAIHTILITIIFLFHPSASQTFQSPSASSKLIQDICKQATKFPPPKFQDCLAAFASDPHAPLVDLKGLAKITLKNGEEHAKEGRKHIQNLLEGSASGLTMPQKEVLKSCMDFFFSSEKSFWSAWGELDVDIDTADYDADFAGYAATNCRKILANAKVSESSVEVRIDQLRMYSKIAGVIVDRL
ncbi:Cell wall / vacuolar inhibitor of fructosidase 2 [Linum grandiflorum]